MHPLAALYPATTSALCLSSLFQNPLVPPPCGLRAFPAGCPAAPDAPSQPPLCPAATNLRVLNGANVGAGAAVQISGAIKSATFDTCDFMGHLASDGGAGAPACSPACLPAVGAGRSLPWGLRAAPAVAVAAGSFLALAC